MIGKTVSHYEILDKAGEGGMGVVYRARDIKLKRDVALKFLPEERTRDRRARAWFIHEARAVSSLEHQNICTIYEIDETEDGQLFMAMAFYDGETLDRRMVGVDLGIDDACGLIEQVAEGLAAAHEQQIFHRDIKPANLIVTRRGVVKIRDFGVAKLTQKTDVTEAGMLLGTLAYMAPEQAEGKEVDGSSDLWSVGVILFEMITGERLLPSGPPSLILNALLNEEPNLQPLMAVAPEDVVQVVQRCLQKRKSHRYRSAAGLLDDLRRRQSVASGPLTSSETSWLPSSIPRAAEVETEDRKPPSSVLLLPDEDFLVDAPTPFVQRESELTRLERTLDLALDGRGQLLFVQGETGQGKTALVNHFCRRAETAHSDLIVAGGKCNAQTGIGDPYLPFREILALLTGDFEAGAAVDRLHRDRAMRIWNSLPASIRCLTEEGPDLINTFLTGSALSARANSWTTGTANWIERVVQLVEDRSRSSHAGLQQSDLFDQYTRVLLAISRKQPMILVLDDLHWVDAGSASLLFHLGRKLQDSRIFIIGTYRPDESGHESGDDHHLRQVVNELTREHGDIELRLDLSEGRQFIDSLLDAEENQFDDAFREAMYEQTYGNPLFTVELLEDLKRDAMIHQNDAGEWTVGPELNWDSMPARTEAVIAGRLAHLPDELRSLLDTAAVEGEDFTAQVLASVRGQEEREVARLLSHELDQTYRLVAAQGMVRVGQQRLARYRFRHSLFQKYLYTSLDEIEQAYLHEDVGKALERLYGDHTADIAVKLARHFEAAGEVEKAAGYFETAGKLAMKLLAYPEAIEHFERALKVIATLGDGPERQALELKVQTPLGAALTVSRGYGAEAVEAAYTRAHELCQQLGAAPELFRVLQGLWTFRLVRHRPLEALELGREMMLLVADQPNVTLRMEAHYSIGVAHLFIGEFEQAHHEFEQAIALDGPGRDKSDILDAGYEVGSASRFMLARTLWFLGDPEQATKIGQESVELARAIWQLPPLIHALYELSIVHQTLGEPAEALKLLEEEVQLAEQHGFIYWQVMGRFMQGWALAQAGGQSLAEGYAQMKQCLETKKAFGTMAEDTYYLSLLASTAHRLGDTEEALRLTQESLDMADSSGEKMWHSELLRLQGEFVLATDAADASDQAADLFSQALEVARAQSAKALELRATASLAELQDG